MEAVNRPGNPPASLTLQAPAEAQHLRLSAGNKKEKKIAICANCTDLHKIQGAGAHGLSRVDEALTFKTKHACF